MKKILIVEDETSLAETLKMRFEAAGYSVDIAGDGQDALAKVRQDKPNLILLDIMLPRIDGYKVCRILKFDEKYRHIPVIMLTAKTQEEDQELGFSVGANAYITKPFDNQELMKKIKELLGEL